MTTAHDPFGQSQVTWSGEYYKTSFGGHRGPPQKKHGPHYLTTWPCSSPLPIRLAHTSIGKRLVGLQLKDFLVSRYYYVAFTCRY